MQTEFTDFQTIATGAARLAMLLERVNLTRMSIEVRDSLAELHPKLQAVAEESAFLVATLLDPTLGSLSDVPEETQNTAAELLANLERAGLMEVYRQGNGRFGIWGETANPASA